MAETNVDTGPITDWEAAVSEAYEGSIKVYQDLVY